jgi:succinate dehydrogenase hydrophobic anchor subunit
MKEWILHRLTSLILIPACLLYPFYSNSYLILLIYVILCYHILHGLLAIFEDYIQNKVYRQAATFVTYLSIIFLFKVVVEVFFS